MPSNHLTVVHGIGALALAAGVGIFGLLSVDKQAIHAADPNLCGIYCQMAVNYGDWLAQQNFDRYYFQKSLSSFLTYLTLFITGLPQTPATANTTLDIFSAVFLVASAWVWYAISRSSALSPSAFWVGMLGMFLCQLFVKLVPYTQESPDTLSFFFGLCTLYAVVTNRHRYLLFLYILVLFVQPQLKIIMAPVFLLAGLTPTETTRRGLPVWLTTFFSFARAVPGWIADRPIFSFGLIFFCYLCVFIVAGYILPPLKPPVGGTSRALIEVMPASILLASVLLAFVMYTLRPFHITRDVLSCIQIRQFWHRFFLLLIIEIAVMIFTGFISKGETLSAVSTLHGTRLAFYSFYFQGVEQPLKFLVAMVVFYGPLAALLVLGWPRIVTQMRQQPDALGFSCALILLTLMLPNSESRHFIAFIPWVTFWFLKDQKFSPLFIALFGIASLASSRFWVTYGTTNTNNDVWVMTWGPWWTPEIYARALILSIIVLAGTSLPLRINSRNQLA